MKPIILAGGTGSRPWLKSLAAMPKQFLSLCSDSTMLQDTILRLKGLSSERPMVICKKDYRF